MKFSVGDELFIKGFRNPYEIRERWCKLNGEVNFLVEDIKNHQQFVISELDLNNYFDDSKFSNIQKRDISNEMVAFPEIKKSPAGKLMEELIHSGWSRGLIEKEKEKEIAKNQNPDSEIYVTGSYKLGGDSNKNGDELAMYGIDHSRIKEQMELRKEKKSLEEYGKALREKERQIIIREGDLENKLEVVEKLLAIDEAKLYESEEKWLTNEPLSIRDQLLIALNQNEIKQINREDFSDLIQEKKTLTDLEFRLLGTLIERMGWGI